MEMLQLVHRWRFDLYRITFVVAETDHTSKQKLVKLIHRTRHVPVSTSDSNHSGRPLCG